jgi:uncharacterized repeat protein (TIGR04052 family)
MSTLIRMAALGLGLLLYGGCSEDEPTQHHGTSYGNAGTELDAAVTIVHESGDRAHDAASPTRGDTSASAGDAGEGRADAAPDSSTSTSGTSGQSSELDAALDAATSTAPQSMDAAQRETGSPGVVDAAPPPARAVTIRFRAIVGSTNMSCGLTYGGVGSNATSAYARDFRFFVQDLRLINAAGKDIPVSIETRLPFQAEGVSLIDFETGASGCGGTPEMNTDITGTVPAGDYRGIAFTNGVPSALNHLDPALAPAPLRARGMNVSQVEGYRFLRAELVQSGAPVDMSGSVELHVNSTGCSDDGKCEKDNRVEVRLSGFDPSKNVVLADLSTLFAKVDLRAITVCHSELELCDPMFDRLGLDYDTGKPSGGQQLYRVSQ